MEAPAFSEQMREVADVLYQQPITEYDNDIEAEMAGLMTEIKAGLMAQETVSSWVRASSSDTIRVCRRRRQGSYSCPSRLRRPSLWWQQRPRPFRPRRPAMSSPSCSSCSGRWGSRASRLLSMVLHIQRRGV